MKEIPERLGIMNSKFDKLDKKIAMLPLRTNIYNRFPGTTNGEEEYNNTRYEEDKETNTYIHIIDSLGTKVTSCIVYR